MTTKLLTSTSDPDYFSRVFELGDGSRGTRTTLDIGEHAGGRLTLYINQKVGDGPWKGAYLTADETAKLRRLLDRAHREREREGR
jgi:hypothetical protein